MLFVSVSMPGLVLLPGAMMPPESEVTGPPTVPAPPSVAPLATTQMFVVAEELPLTSSVPALLVVGPV